MVGNHGAFANTTAAETTTTTNTRRLNTTNATVLSSPARVQRTATTRNYELNLTTGYKRALPYKGIPGLT